MDKPKKQVGFWGFTGIFVSLFFLAYILMGVIYLSFIAPFVSRDSILAIVMFNIMEVSGVISAIFLAVHIYAKRRRITSEFANKISLIYLMIGGVFFLYNMARAFIWPELIYIRSVVIVTLLVFFVMRKLLLRKARQQELEISETPSAKEE